MALAAAAEASLSSPLRGAEIHVLVPPEELRREALEIAGDAYRHLFRARRLARGQRVRVADGAGSARWATVENVGRESARLVLLEACAPRDPSVRLEIAVPPIRRERASWLVEKATELGAAAILFFPCARAQLDRERLDLDRFRRVAAAALEQCGGATLPVLDRVASFEELVGRAAERRTLLLDREGSPGRPEARHGGEPPWLVVGGPEGGLVREEVAALIAAGARTLALGPRTLRTETAAIAAAAVLLQREQESPTGDAATRPSR